MISSTCGSGLSPSTRSMRAERARKRPPRRSTIGVTSLT
jgi:hypothetical protein